MRQRTRSNIEAELSEAIARLPLMRQALATSVMQIANKAPGAVAEGRKLNREARELNMLVRRLQKELLGM